MSDAAGTHEAECKRLFELVNEYRAANKRALLKWDDEIAALCQKHADDMAKKKKPSSTVFQNWKAPYMRVVLNVGTNKGSADGVADCVKQWTNATSYRNNMLGEVFEAAGVGIAATPEGWYFFAMVFGWRRVDSLFAQWGAAPASCPPPDDDKLPALADELIENINKVRAEKGLALLAKHAELAEAAASQAASIQKKGRVAPEDFEARKAELKCAWTTLGELHSAQRNVKNVVESTISSWRRNPEDLAVILSPQLNAVGATLTVVRKSSTTFCYVLLAAIAQ